MMPTAMMMPMKKATKAATAAVEPAKAAYGCLTRQKMAWVRWCSGSGWTTDDGCDALATTSTWGDRRRRAMGFAAAISI